MSPGTRAASSWLMMALAVEIHRQAGLWGKPTGLLTHPQKKTGPTFCLFEDVCLGICLLFFKARILRSYRLRIMSMLVIRRAVSSPWDSSSRSTDIPRKTIKQQFYAFPTHMQLNFLNVQVSNSPLENAHHHHCPVEAHFLAVPSSMGQAAFLHSVQQECFEATWGTGRPASPSCYTMGDLWPSWGFPEPNVTGDGVPQKDSPLETPGQSLEGALKEEAQHQENRASARWCFFFFSNSHSKVDFCCLFDSDLPASSFPQKPLPWSHHQLWCSSPSSRMQQEPRRRGRGSPDQFCLLRLNMPGVAACSGTYSKYLI